MILKGHNLITATARANRFRVEWLPCATRSFGLNTCPNTNSDLGTQLAGFNAIGGQQLANYSQGMR
jgi:hypothetical protein